MDAPPSYAEVEAAIWAAASPLDEQTSQIRVDSHVHSDLGINQIYLSNPLVPPSTLHRKPVASRYQSPHISQEKVPLAPYYPHPDRVGPFTVPKLDLAPSGSPWTSSRPPPSVETPQTPREPASGPRSPALPLRPGLPVTPHSTPFVPTTDSLGVNAQAPATTQLWNSGATAIESAAPFSDLEIRPELPPRALSAPVQPTLGKPVLPLGLHQSQFYKGRKDQKKAFFATRLVGNMLIPRLGRAALQSVVSSATLSTHLSPWGDNNPVTLPNIRTRDVALSAFMHFGADALAPSCLDMVGELVKDVADFGADAGADFGLEAATDKYHEWFDKPQSYFVRAGINTTQLRIKHKLMGESAELALFGSRPAENHKSCAKGWFCPYLYSSGRAACLERSTDFAMAELWGPGLAADASVAPTILRCLTYVDDAPVTALCPWESPCPERPQYCRMAMFLLGISPYRTSVAWSQARLPNEARLQFHLFSNIPVLVFPVRTSTPICAWSSKTLKQIWDGQLTVDDHVAEILSFLDVVVDPEGMTEWVRLDWDVQAVRTLQQIFEMAAALKTASKMIKRVIDIERAGLVAFRY